jgi:WD40 repeat protein
MMADVFISYSRKDSDFVRRLFDALAAQKRDMWVDWEDIPRAANWIEEIYAGIESSNTFIFVTSANSLASEICHLEIERAIQHNKRLIPVIYQDVKEKTIAGEWFEKDWENRARANWQAIKHLNWLFFREQDDFDTAFHDLIATLDTDLDYVKAHTRLLVRAREWEINGHNRSYLLSGDDLRSAEEQLAESGGKEPKPTALQTHYILTSRQMTNLRQRNLLAGVSVALVVTGLLAILSFGLFRQSESNLTLAQSRGTEVAQQAAISDAHAATAVAAQGTAVFEQQRAEDNAATAIAEGERANQEARVALARQVSAQALNLMDEQEDLALLLSVEGFRIWDSAESRDTLLTVLQANPSLERSLRNHETRVQALAISPDGKWLASGDNDGLVVLWDLAAEQLNGNRLSGHYTAVQSLMFSSDSRTLLSGDGFGEVIVWDVAHGPQINLDDHVSTYNPSVFELDDNDQNQTMFPTNLRFVSASAFSPDRRTIVLGTEEQAIARFDVVNGEITGKPNMSPEGLIYKLIFSPDGSLIASSEIQSGSVQIHHLDDTTLTLPDVNASELAFSPDNRHLAIGKSVAFGIIIYDSMTGQKLQEIVPSDDTSSGYASNIQSLAYSPDGNTLAIGDSDGVVQLLNVVTGEFVGEPFTGHNSPVTIVAFSPDGSQLFSGSDDGTIITWQTQSESRLGSPLFDNDMSEFALNLALSPDGNTLAYTVFENDSDEERIILRDRVSHQFIGDPLMGHRGTIRTMEFSPDGETLASADEAGDIILWDMATGQQIQTLSLGEPETIVDLDFNTDGSILASANYELGTVILWDMTTFQPVGNPLHYRSEAETVLNMDGWVTNLAFSPDGALLAFSSSAGIAFWDVTRYELIHEIPQDDTIGPIFTMDFSPDGAILATGGTNNNVNLWRSYLSDTPSRQLLTGHTSIIWSLAFTADGKTLASNDRLSISLWDVASGQLLGQPLITAEGPITDLAFTPDSNTLLAGSRSGITFWEIGDQSLIEQACHRANLSLTPDQWQQYFGSLSYNVTCPQALGGLWAAAQQANAIFRQGEIERAEGIFEQAVDWALQANSFSDVCLYGAMSGFAELILPTCDAAVENSPMSGGRGYEARSIARAILGDYTGAAEDLSLYIQWLHDFRLYTSFEGERRDEWLVELQNSRNPYDSETLEYLHEYYQ